MKKNKTNQDWNSIVKITKSPEELIELGKSLGSKVTPGTIIHLNGELGSGKTTFTKGIAQGLNIKSKITSPTYTIIKEYENKLCHVDAYRIKEEDIGIEHYINLNYVICIEWFENLIQDYGKNIIEVNIQYHELGRKITILEPNE